MCLYMRETNKEWKGWGVDGSLKFINGLFYRKRNIEEYLDFFSYFTCFPTVLTF